MAEQFIPFHDRITVRRAESQEDDGVIIPESSKEKLQRGEVVGVGRGRYENGALIPMQSQPGDTVLFGRHAGVEIEVAGETVLVMREEEVLGSMREAISVKCTGCKSLFAAEPDATTIPPHDCNAGIGNHESSGPIAHS